MIYRESKNGYILNVQTTNIRHGLIPKDAPTDDGVPSGAGSEFSVEKVPGGFEVT